LNFFGFLYRNTRIKKSKTVRFAKGEATAFAHSASSPPAEGQGAKSVPQPLLAFGEA
jgi:hypothetical protein